MSNPTLLTTQEVADRFRVSIYSIARWARAGVLPAMRTPGGGEWRFREEDVAEFFARRPRNGDGDKAGAA